MGIISTVKEFIMNAFRKNAEREFDVTICSTPEMEQAQKLWMDIVQGNPTWLSKNTRTINFAKYISEYTAKKVCMDLAVHIEGSERADYISGCVNAMVDKSLRDKVEDAIAIGGIILKPNGTYNKDNAIDYLLPSSYAITEKTSNGDILGCLFVDRITKGTDRYTRLEYHHFIMDKEQKLYKIEQRAYKSAGNGNSIGDRIPLAKVEEWKDLKDEITIDNVEKPLFAYLKMPANNTIDFNSPEGVSIFNNCVEELKDLDVAWSRKSDEVYDSQHITFMDETAITQPVKIGGKVQNVMKDLPRFVKGMRKGVDSASTIDEHVATLLTGQRVEDINSILSMISTKAGFSQGQFVLDRKTGVITATQIESQDSETVETINDIRKALKSAVKGLVYALDKYCDVFFDMPSGYVNVLDDEIPEEDIFYFKDLLATPEQDRSRAYQLVLQGMYSKRKYLKEYEGFSDEEIDEMMQEIVTEVQQNAQLQQGLFD